MRKVNGSIVIYYNSEEKLLRTINSFFTSNIVGDLFLIDNSKSDYFKKLIFLNKNIRYIFNNANLGYGKAHNIALRRSIEENVPYHLVLNPDVYFESGVLEELYNFMEANEDVGLVMPKVLYPDGNIQYLCKLLPTPLDLFGRRFLNFGPFKKIVKKRNEIYELRFTGYDKIMEVPYLSGCFMFIRTEVLKKVGSFDERFFMYLEDTDLSRRIYRVAKTVYYPYVHIYHEYGKGSYKSLKLLYYHIKSAIKYFNKYGWFFDKERKEINERILKKIRLVQPLDIWRNHNSLI
jgi:GT2 family glycosyltransferase